MDLWPLREGARYFQEDPTHYGGLVNDTTPAMIAKCFGAISIVVPGIIVVSVGKIAL